jgi:hypothetical protein
MRKTKTLVILTIILLALSITTPMVSAKKESNNGKRLAKGKNGRPAASNGLNNEKSPVQHLYLYEKDPDTWDIVDEGAFGKLTILTHKDKYIFNAHRLDPILDYSMINYAPGTTWDPYPEPDPWPGEDSVEINSGTTNEEGDIHMKGEWDSETEGKIWLVLSNDFDAESEPTKMIGWNPTEYLFEYDLLTDYE